MIDLNDELSFALGLAVEAGEIARSYWCGDAAALNLRQKPRGGGPVTQADLEIDALCVDRIAARFPGDDIVAEESHRAGRPATSRRRWYVDPIDGTRDFARGRPGWAVLVGLCIDETPVLGVVHEPARPRTAWAIDTAHDRRALEVDGALPSGPDDPRARALCPSDRPLSSARLAAGRIFPLTRAHAIRRVLQIAPDRVRTVGSVGLRIAMVARGEADVYVQPPGRTRAWDTCAASVLATAAGAAVRDILGAPLRYPPTSTSHRVGVVVAQPGVEAEVLRRVALLGRRWGLAGPEPPIADLSGKPDRA